MPTINSRFLAVLFTIAAALLAFRLRARAAAPEPAKGTWLPVDH